MVASLAHSRGLDALPVVGFETSELADRKHVKGDLLNLQDAAVSLGVIVLAGADAKNEPLRRFATQISIGSQDPLEPGRVSG